MSLYRVRTIQHTEIKERRPRRLRLSKATYASFQLGFFRGLRFDYTDLQQGGRKSAVVDISTVEASSTVIRISLKTNAAWS